MKCLPCTLLLLLLPVACPGFAQPPAGKPVLSAAPEVPAPPPDTSPAAPTGPIAVDPSYVIGAEDSIQVSVWEQPNFPAASLPVRPDGMITLPLVGDIPAAGRTPTQLASQITELLKKFINDPNVTVSVLGVNSKHIFMVGEIGKVGPLPLTPGMTVLQAIATAGGPSTYANKKKIYILRGEKKIPFDYNKAVKTGNMQGVTLVNGDTIVLP